MDGFDAASAGQRTAGADFTFADLRAEHRAEFGARPGWNNTKSALSDFMRAHGLNDTSRLAPIMTTEFHDRLRAYVEGTDKAPSTVSSYETHLRGWHTTAVRMELAVTGASTFGETLTIAMNNQGVNPDILGRQLNMNISRIRKWAKGLAMPYSNARTKTDVLRVEEALGLPRYTLWSKVWLSTDARVDDREKSRAKSRIDFRKIIYRGKELPANAEAVVKKLFEYKTARLPGKNAIGDRLQRESTWRKTPDGQCESYQIFLAYIRAFFGWLTLPGDTVAAAQYIIENRRNKRPIPDKEVAALAPYFVGKGIKKSDLNFVQIVDPVLLSEFVEWRTFRMKSESGYQRKILREALGLLREDLGFLYQQVEYVWDYMKWEAPDLNTPAGQQAYRERRAQWQAICKDWRADINSTLDTFSPDAKARDPHVILRPILDLENPMSLVGSIIARHARGRPIVAPQRSRTSGLQNKSVLYALWVRDQLLLRMMASNPLRNRNYREMTWRPDNKGNLYKLHGEWRLRFSPSDFKNEKGAARKPYDVEVPAYLHSLIGEYIRVQCPVLMRHESEDPTDAVFVTKGGLPFSVSQLSDLVYRLTTGYLDELPDVDGWRTHAFRHIVATAWLRNHPGDYLRVAQILHDDIKTVLENYAWTQPDHGLKPYNAWLAAHLPPLEV